jgi:hypothetical protein
MSTELRCGSCSQHEEIARLRAELTQRNVTIAAVRPVIEAASAAADGWFESTWEVDQFADHALHVLHTALATYQAAQSAPAEAGTRPKPARKPVRYLASVCDTCRHTYNDHASTG